MKEIIGYTPTSYQKQMHNIVNERQYKEYYFVLSRQMGKSMFALQHTLYSCINNDNFLTAYITPTFSLSKKIFDEISGFLEKTKICKKINRSELLIEFNNGSKIKFYTAENPLAIRGTTWDLFILEEGAFFDDFIFTQVIKPTLMVRKGIAICVTTPFLKNWLYKKTLSARNSKSIFYMKKTIWDNELISAEQIEEIIENTPKHIFEIEYNCSFDVSEKSLFDNINDKIIKTPVDYKNKKLYAGIDLGRVNDYTVVTIVDVDGNMVDMLRINQMSWDLIEEKVISFLSKYNISSGFIEVNNIGDVIAERIIKRNNKIEIFKTTSQSKNPLVENLILEWENGGVKILDDENVKNEFESFGFEFSKITRNIKYAAITGHDDIIMSLALAFWAKKVNKNKGTYAIG